MLEKPEVYITRFYAIKMVFRLFHKPVYESRDLVDEFFRDNHIGKVIDSYWKYNSFVDFLCNLQKKEKNNAILGK